MTTVIRVENLGKKYLIRHEQQSQHFRYDSLGESLVNGGKEFCRRLLHPFASSLKMPTQEEFWALKDINFEIQQGDRVGIIGRNGAGKSTLLKILSRITKPTTGRVLIKGRVASLLEVGTGFHPELTGRENIFLNGAILGMKRKEITRKFDEIVAFAEVDKFLDTPVKHYSSGMYVRLAFAVAAHLEPEILIVDEVLAVGDTSFQKKCFSKMRLVSDSGRTILFVSHNMPAVRGLCQQCILLDKGFLTRQGRASEIIDKYNNNMVSSFSQKLATSVDELGIMSLNIDYVLITNGNNKVVEKLNTDDDFNIEIHYEVLKNSSIINLTIILYDSNRDIIFSSINNLDKEWYGKGKPAGKYISRCKIPANLLNNKTFIIGLYIFEDGFTEGVLIDNVLKFEIEDGQSVRGDYLGVYEGSMRPLLEWTTIQIDKPSVYEAFHVK